MRVAASRFRRLWPENGAANSLPALDGIRAVAVLLVMVYHAWHITPNLAPANEDLNPLYWTRTGVHLFFVLSGFLLFTPYAQWLFGLGTRPTTRRFYMRRILRVGPAYWVCLAILAGTAPLTSSRLFDVLAHSTFAFNVFPASLFSINGVFWSMAVEVQFYALLPLLAAGTFLIARRYGALNAAAALVTVLVVISVVSGWLGNRLDPTESHPVSTAIFGKWSVSFFLSVFGAGAAASVIYIYVTRVARLSDRERGLIRRLAAAAFAVGVLLAVGLAAAAPYEHRYSFGKNILFGFAYGSIVLGVVLGPRRLRAPFEWAPLRFVGLISYSLYLWHTVAYTPVSGVLGGVSSANLRFALGLCLELAIALPIAYLSYMLAERPFMVARASLRDQDRTAAFEQNAVPDYPVPTLVPPGSVQVT